MPLERGSSRKNGHVLGQAIKILQNALFEGVIYYIKLTQNLCSVKRVPYDA